MRLIAALFILFSSTVGNAAELLMFEEQGCIWCRRFDAEIAPAYAKTTEGQQAPLRRVDVRQQHPVDISFTEAPRFTPTFILVENNQEVGRITGYPGTEFFYPLLTQLLAKRPNKMNK
jgi:thioredoxin-related protein